MALTNATALEKLYLEDESCGSLQTDQGGHGIAEVGVRESIGLEEGKDA